MSITKTPLAPTSPAGADNAHATPAAASTPADALAVSDANAGKFELNPKLIVPFVQSVKNVLSTMAGVQTTVERPHFKTTHCAEYDYSGIIAFSGKIIGTVVVSFQREAAIALVAAFAGDKIEPETPDFADAIGELANMISGAAKKDLGSMASISVPSVIMGKNHTVFRPHDIPCLVIPCMTPVGNFAVEVSLKSA
jgi:chemotaxis protein CheX